MGCIACQAPLSMGLSWQESWSGLPFTLTGDLPDPGIEPASPVSPALQVDSLPTEPTFLRLPKLGKYEIFIDLPKETARPKEVQVNLTIG